MTLSVFNDQPRFLPKSLMSKEYPIGTMLYKRGEKYVELSERMAKKLQNSKRLWFFGVATPKGVQIHGLCEYITVEPAQ